MSEQEIRDGLRAAVWDEPPLDFDPDTLIAKAEKVRSRRRALVSVGVGTAMVVMSAFALPTLVNRSAPDPGVQVAQSQTTGPLPKVETTNERNERLHIALVKRFIEVTPGAREVTTSFREGYPPLNPHDTQTGYVLFTDDIGPTALQVRFGTVMDVSQLCGGSTTCQPVHNQDGSSVLLAEYRNSPSEVTQALATHKRKDGSVVTFVAFSMNPTNGQGARQTVPVGVETLRRLVTDPQISWDP